MSVCNKNFNSKISVHSGHLEFSLVAASKEIPKWAPILRNLSCGPKVTDTIKFLIYLEACCFLFVTFRVVIKGVVTLPPTASLNETFRS